MDWLTWWRNGVFGEIEDALVFCQAREVPMSEYWRIWIAPVFGPSVRRFLGIRDQAAIFPRFICGITRPPQPDDEAPFTFRCRILRTCSIQFEEAKTKANAVFGMVRFQHSTQVFLNHAIAQWRGQAPPPFLAPSRAP